MKKILVIILLLIAVGINTAQACEICGCGVGNFYLGLVPKFNSKFVGIRYRSVNYSSRMHNEPTEYSNDYYKTIELWGGISVSKKVQLLMFLPYQYNQRITDDGEKISSGLGDVTILANYNLWSNSSLRTNQQLWLGGGVKAPTGQYKIDFSDPEINLGDPNAQAGTGSLDFIVNINHTVSFGKWGINTSTNYKINTSNQDQYKFGNRFTANTLAYYQFALKSLNIAPVVGATYDQSAGNSYMSKEIELTGGQAVFAATGFEMSYGVVAAGVNVQLPIGQNFADHQTTSGPRGLVHLTFTF